MIDKDDSATFYPLKNDLYINKKGEIAYRAFDQTVPGDVRDVFLRYVNNFDTVNHPRKEIEFVVDTASFEPLGDLYYRDKRFAYYHFPMMDGGFFDIIWKAEPKTLKVLAESWYAKDRHHIFCRGRILNEADFKTFTVFPLVSDGDTVRWLGKDKKNFYDSHDILDKKTIKDWNLN